MLQYLFNILLGIFLFLCLKSIINIAESGTKKEREEALAAAKRWSYFTSSICLLTGTVGLIAYLIF